MKKLYATMFVAALGAGAMFAEGPVLSTVWTKAYDLKVGEFDPEAPNWSSADAIKATSGMQNATGVAGKLYGVDMKTMSVTAFDENGATTAYTLPSLAGKTVTSVSLNEAGEATATPDFYGSLITRDDAGHLLIGHAQGTGACINYWTVLDRATGATKDLTYDPGTNLRSYLPISMVGRALGDVTKEGYLYLAPTSIYWPTIMTISWVGDYKFIQRVKINKFAGDGTLGSTTMEGHVTGPVPMANWLLTTASPWFPTVDKMKETMAANEKVSLDQTFFFYSRLQGSNGGQWDFNCGIINPDAEYKLIYPAEFPDGLFEGQMVSTSNDLLGYNRALYDAFDIFELGGERYYVASFNEDSELKGEGVISFAIFDSEGYEVYDSSENALYWEYEGDWSDEGHAEGPQTVPSGSMTINTEKVDDNNVNIYVWAQCEENGVFAGMFNFGNGNTGLTAVNEVAVEANNEAPVYYNLNGVRVANPANGIFIEKRGSKVTKVIK